MSNITVTTNQQVIEVTETGGVDVTNTTNEITVLTAGTLIIEDAAGTITSVNGQTGPIVVLDTDDIPEGTNKYFSQALARGSLSAGTGISYDSGTGVITNTSINTDTTYTIASASTTGGANLNLVGSDSSTDSVAYKGSGATTVTSTDANTITIASTDTNTTYTQNASSTSGGANLNLVGSDSTTDSIKLAGGTNVTVTRTDADTVTFSATDTNTTYTIASGATSGGANLTLTGSDSSTDSVAYLGSGATTVTSTDANTVTISSTDTNTTYTQNASSTSGGANLNLVGSDSTTDSVAYLGSGATTVTRTDANTITVSSIDTNTTYIQNISSTTGGANLNLVGSDSTTDTVKFANGTGVTVTQTDADTATISIGQSVGTGDSPSFAGITGGNITVGVATDQTISTTTGSLILNSVSGTITMNSAGTLGFTLNPITGFNPNADFTGNIVKGVIRTGAGEAAGDIWQTSGAGSPSTGISIDNTDKPASRSSLVIRNYGAGLAGGNPRLNVIGEAARGTAAAPLNLNSGNVLIDIFGNGYTNTGWVTDLGATIPSLIRLNTQEAWTNGLNNVGTGFQLLTQPTATPLTAATLQATINANPQSSAIRSDQLLINDRTINQAYVIMNGRFNEGSPFSVSSNLLNTNSNAGSSVGISSNYRTGFTSTGSSISGTTLTIGTQTGGSGVATGQTLYGTGVAVGTTITANISGSGSGSTWTVNVSQTTASTAISGSGGLTLPQINNKLGNFRFNSYQDTAGVSALAAQVISEATENWELNANGTRLIFLANKKGQNWTTGHSQVASFAPESSAFTSDVFTIENSAGTDYAIFDSSNTTLTKPLKLNGSTSGSITMSAGATPATQSYTLPTAYPADDDYRLVSTTAGVMSWAPPGTGFARGSFIYTGSVTGSTANTSTILPLNTTLDSGITLDTSISGTGTITVAKAGIYAINLNVQVNNTASGQDHVVFFWLRKNGSDVAYSATDYTIIKSGYNVASLNFLQNAAVNDTFECWYQVDNAALEFTTIPATTTPTAAIKPVAPSIVVNLTQVG